MDRLFSKYACPFPFLDGMIQTRRFAEFVREFWELQGEQKLWELYLAKDIDKSFNDFKESLLHPAPEKMTESQLEATIKHSKSVLMKFNPEE